MYTKSTALKYTHTRKMSSTPALMDTLPQSETECIKKKLSIKSIKIISAIQLISALVAVLTEMVIISDHDRHHSNIGVGIWTGFFIALSGLTGLLTAQKPSKSKYVIYILCIISIYLLYLFQYLINNPNLGSKYTDMSFFSIFSLTAFMVMRISSAVFCLTLIVFAGIGFGHTTHHICLGMQMFAGLVAALSTFYAFLITCHPDNDSLSQSETEHLKKKLSKKAIIIISIIQLISALVAVVTELTIVSDGGNEYIKGTGIWTGFFIALPGLTGILTAQKPSKSKYVYCIIFTILISIFNE